MEGDQGMVLFGDWEGSILTGLDTSGRLIGLIFLMRYVEEAYSLSLKDYAK